MISEKELKARMAGSLEAIKREIPALCESLGAREKDVAVATVSAFKTIEGIVDDLATKGGWIPCSERSPEDCKTVIFATEDGFVEAGWYDAKKNWCVHDGYFPNAFNFVAWMPLPEPYKGKENE